MPLPDRAGRAPERADPADVVEVDRIPVTSLAWTTVEVAGRLDEIRRRDLLAAVVATGRLSVAELVAVADRGVGIPRRPRVLADLGSLGPHFRSRTERRVVDACGAAGLPTPEVNVVVPTAGGRSDELDLLWRWAGLDVEVDGLHHLEPGQRQRDRQRDRDLADVGIDVLRIPVADVDDDLDGVVARIARKLGARRDDNDDRRIRTLTSRQRRDAS